MATPFSPFVGKRLKPDQKRRQSQVPADLIDWDAPEIPELDKQRIIYEDHIKEIVEDYEIEILINEQINSVAHETYLSELNNQTGGYQSKIKDLENELKSQTDEYQAKIKSLEDGLQSKTDEFTANLKNLEDQLQSQIDESQTKIKMLEGELTTERSRVHLLLGQLKMTEDQENEKRSQLADYKIQLEAIRTRILSTHSGLS